MAPGAARAVAALSLIACGLLATAALDKGIAGIAAFPESLSVLDPPALSLERRPGRIVLTGVAGTGEDESMLRRHARNRFADAMIETHFEPGVVIPRYWRATAEHLLDVLATTDSASATIDASGITLRAVTTDGDAASAKLDALRDALAADTPVDADVVVVDTDLRFDPLCRRVFEHAHTGTVTFPQSSTVVGDASYALLDRIVDFANDCRDFTIAVIGYSDNVGEESWNRAISLSRARSVADYIAGAGIPAARIAVEGRGSAEPIADNGTPAGRLRNRRVEFELREASP